MLTIRIPSLVWDRTWEEKFLGDMGREVQKGTEKALGVTRVGEHRNYMVEVEVEMLDIERELIPRLMPLDISDMLPILSEDVVVKIGDIPGLAAMGREMLGDKDKDMLEAAAYFQIFWCILDTAAGLLWDKYQKDQEK